MTLLLDILTAIAQVIMAAAWTAVFLIPYFLLSYRWGWQARNWRWGVATFAWMFVWLVITVMLSNVNFMR